MTDLGPLHHFLGITIERRTDGLFLSQRQYGTLVSNPTQYRSIVGALQYLTFTRSDIDYVVQQVCLHIHDPRDPHLASMKQILWYLEGTSDLGLHLYPILLTDLTIYSDAD